VYSLLGGGNIVSNSYDIHQVKSRKEEERYRSVVSQADHQSFCNPCCTKESGRKTSSGESLFWSPFWFLIDIHLHTLI